MDKRSAYALLTTEEMGRADAATIAGGVPGIDLMEAAGRGVAEHARRAFPDAGSCLVLAGPGNNGGDGFVAARHLAQMGLDVSLACLVPAEKLSGDAAWAAGTWEGGIATFGEATPEDADIVIDAVFGAGLTRPIDGPVRDLLERANAATNVVAVDVPSGVDGSTGAVLGYAPQAALTVTFFRKKPAHCLYPGRGLMGEVAVIDIGIPETVLDDIAPACWENGAGMWRDAWPAMDPLAHKYARGHVGVLSGGVARTGAARLAAMAALRTGAGLVSVLSPGEAVAENATQLTAVMVKPITEDPRDIARAATQFRLNTLLAGPGMGTDDKAAARLAALVDAASAQRLVLDADALTVVGRDPDRWFAAFPPDTILTPHAGEFARVFGDIDEASKLARTRRAADRAGAVVLLKGPDTVIAAPDGRAVINTDAPATLATAGSGDVLAGIAAGLLARGMAPFEAACAATGLHAVAARAFGPGLIAEDLPAMLPQVLASLDLF